MRGAPARAIQELAGHQDLATTQRYMHLSPAAIEGAPLVLVRLSRVDRDALRDLLSVSWRLTSAKTRKRARRLTSD